MKIDVDAYYMKVCERDIESNGYDPKTANLLFPYIADDDTRFRVWRAAAALKALRYLDGAYTGDERPYVWAFRCYTLAREYHGRLHSVGHSAMCDTLDKIEQYIGDVLIVGGRAVEGR